MLADEPLPADSAGVWGGVLVVLVELGLLTEELGGVGEVRAEEAAVLGATDGVVLQAQLEERDLAGLVVADQPVVGIAAVVAVEHDPDEVVDGPAVLHGPAGARELGLAGG